MLKFIICALIGQKMYDLNYLIGNHKVKNQNVPMLFSFLILLVFENDLIH